MRKTFTINSRKYNGKIHRSWKAELLEENDEIILFVGIFEEEVNHNNLGIIGRGTLSYEYYWKNRWFNVFRFHEPMNGKLRNFYCNINRPPHLTDNTLDYIDLEIDVLVWNDFSVEILDLDEFEQNARRYQFPAELITTAHKSLDELLEMIEQRTFPFDYL